MDVAVVCVNICLPWFVYQEPEKHLTLSIIGVYSLIIQWVYFCPRCMINVISACKVTPRLTVSRNFTHFFSSNSWSTCRCARFTSHSHKWCFLRSIFVSLRLDINTNTRPPWQVSLANRSSPEVMATGTGWEIWRWRLVGLTLQPSTTFLSLIFTPTLINTLWPDVFVIRWVIGERCLLII